MRYHIFSRIIIVFIIIVIIIIEKYIIDFIYDNDDDDNLRPTLYLSVVHHRVDGDEAAISESMHHQLIVIRWYVRWYKLFNKNLNFFLQARSIYFI